MRMSDDYTLQLSGILARLPLSRALRPWLVVSVAAGTSRINLTAHGQRFRRGDIFGTFGILAVCTEDNSSVHTPATGRPCRRRQIYETARRRRWHSAG